MSEEGKERRSEGGRWRGRAGWREASVGRRWAPPRSRPGATGRALPGPKQERERPGRRERETEGTVTTAGRPGRAGAT
ncbi:hypothetical protein NL676_022094 [Syzygium grande]|nr:hypothetical protein NL676_022094 [Syzygium grande]